MSKAHPERPTAAAAAPESDFDLPAAGCLAFLRPALAHAFGNEAGWTWIEDMAATLPPVPRLALELRLGRQEAPPDLHQQFRAACADGIALGRSLSASPEGPLAFPALRRFLDRWAVGEDSAEAAFDTLYLEWDQQMPGSAPAAPGLFFPVERPSDSVDERAARRSAAAQQAQALRPGLGEAVGAALDTLAARVPVGVTVSFVGFMLGRDGAFRVNLRGVRRGDLAQVLAAMDWPGDAVAAAGRFERLVDLSDRVVVALDFAPSLQPGIGFEIVLNRQPGADSRWIALFDALAAEDLCTARQRQALLSFSADFFPENEDGPAWPGSWLIAALLSPASCLPWVERRISHLKLSLRPNGEASAKAYVSAEHHWSRQVVRPCAPPARSPAAAALTPDALVAQAKARAVGFLAGAISQDDLWRDFSMPGASDEWVTGFVGWALAGEEDERAQVAAARGVAALLARQRPDGGWGYNPVCDSDADSTAWALRLLHATDHAGPAVARAESFLRAHLLPGGGVATFRREAILRFENRPWHGPSRGWRGSHLCVAANAAGALPGLLEPFLRTSQSGNGSWTAYWWRTDAFSTGLAVDALVVDAVAGEAASSKAVERALAWARAQSSGQAFDRAWVARILASGDGDDRKAAGSLLGALAREQEADGGWAASASLLLPHPSHLTRHKELAPYLDIRRLFTTASVVAAMTVLAQKVRA